MEGNGDNGNDGPYFLLVVSCSECSNTMSEKRQSPGEGSHLNKRVKSEPICITDYTKTTESTEQTLEKENKVLKEKIDESLETIQRYESKITQLSSDKTILTRELSLKEQQLDFLLKKYNFVMSKLEQRDAKDQKLVAVSHTDVKAREVYANAVREQGVKDMSASVKVFEEVITKVTNVLTEEKLKLKETVIENLANNIENIREKIIKIQESQKKMETKGPDGKLLCGDCDRMFGSVSALKRHMTVTHGVNTSDIWKNQLNIDDVWITETK